MLYSLRAEQHTKHYTFSNLIPTNNPMLVRLTQVLWLALYVNPNVQ